MVGVLAVGNCFFVTQRENDTHYSDIAATAIISIPTAVKQTFSFL